MKPLANPRPRFDPVEMNYIREQAEYYYTMKESSPGFEFDYALMPACDHCGSDVFEEDHINCALIFDCGHKISTISPLRAGRLARR